MSNIKDKASITIAGAVENVFTTKNGTAFGVLVIGKGDFKQRYTVWNGGEEVATGDRVVVIGVPSASVRENEGKHYANLSLNFAKVLEHEPLIPTAAPTTDSTFPVDSDAPF